MGIFDKASYAARYAFSNDESELGPLLRLGVASLLSFLIVPILTVVGYGFNVIESAMNDEQIPEFTDPLQLTKEGLVGMVMFVPLLFISIFMILASLFVFSSPLISGVLYILTSVTLGYATPIVVGLHAQTRTLSGTYNFSKITGILTDGSYLISVTGLFIFTTVFSFVLSLASALVVTAPFVIALQTIAQSAYLGNILSERIEDEGEEDSSYTIPT